MEPPQQRRRIEEEEQRRRIEEEQLKEQLEIRRQALTQEEKEKRRQIQRRLQILEPKTQGSIFDAQQRRWVKKPKPPKWIFDPEQQRWVVEQQEEEQQEEQQEEQLQSKEPINIYHPRPTEPTSIFQVFGSTPQSSAAELKMDIEGYAKKIRKDEETLFDRLNSDYNWDADGLPRNVDEMYAFLKANNAIRNQIDDLFTYYYMHNFDGENPLKSSEISDEQKELIRVSFLINLVENENFGEHEKYLDNDITLENINALITSVRTQPFHEQGRNKRKQAHIERLRLKTEELTERKQSLEDEIRLFRSTGTPKDLQDLRKATQDLKKLNDELVMKRRKLDELTGNGAVIMRGRGKKKNSRLTRKKRKKRKSRCLKKRKCIKSCRRK